MYIKNSPTEIGIADLKNKAITPKNTIKAVTIPDTI